jgi:hypothetical protein
MTQLDYWKQTGEISEPVAAQAERVLLALEKAASS